MLRALRAEIWKLKRSFLPLWTAAIALASPLMVTLSVQKQDMVGIAWPDFMRACSQVFTSWFALVLFGLVAAHLFGREYAEGTARDMLTLPVRRESFLAAKAMLLAVWVLGLTLLSVAAQAGQAASLGLDGASMAGVRDALVVSLKAAALVSATLPVVVLLAIRGRGYLAPMSFSAVMAIVGMSVAMTGHTRWFPWSMPIGVTGVGLFPAVPLEGLVTGSWLLAAALFVTGCAAVVWYVDTVDAA